jgi:hypothetical protein
MAQPGWHSDRCVISHFPMDTKKGGDNAGKKLTKKQVQDKEDGGSENEGHRYLMGIGLNSIPAWCQTYKSLSQGERYPTPPHLCNTFVTLFSHLCNTFVTPL